MSEPQHNLPASDPTLPMPHEVNGAPRNPDVFHERTDVDTRAVVWSVTALGVSLVVVMLLLWGMFALFLNAENAQKRSSFPVAVQVREQQTDEQRLPPQPRLEGIGPPGTDINIGRLRPIDIKPQHDVGRVRPSAAAVLYEAQEQALGTYAWVEADRVARIPIEEAMKRLAGKLPARKDGRGTRSRVGDEYLEQPSQSSSGRVPRGGQP
jgi:hypothetical protein